MTTPRGLASGGRALWRAICDAHDLDAPQLAQLTEACRAKDRLDRLDLLLQDELDPAVLTQANATANLMKQLIAALRLPDAQTGKKPQYRGPRGVQVPSAPGGAGSIKDRLRAVSP